MFSEKEADAIQLNLVNDGAKVLNYFGANGADPDFENVLNSTWFELRLRLDPEFGLGDNVIDSAESARNMAVILRNAGKHEQAAPLLELLKDKRALIEKYSSRSDLFSRNGLKFVDPFELLFPEQEDRLKYPYHLAFTRQIVREQIIRDLSIPEEFEEDSLNSTKAQF